MIPNVNQLTTELRMMPDAALQRMAENYKQDPYIFPMIISESMARKKLRAAGQAQAQAMQGTPPKVVDQALMAMAPESAGIGALQAPNMERMADGGIAGYADGGDVVMSPGSTPSYQRTAMSPGMLDFAQHSEPVIRMAEGGVARYADQGLVQTRINPYIEGILALDPDMDEQGLPRTRRESEMIRAKQKEALEKKKEAETYAGQLSATLPTEYRERMEQFYRPRRTPEQLAGGPVLTKPAPTPTASGAGTQSQTPPAAAGAQAKPPAAPGIAVTPAATGPGRAEDILAKTEREGLRRLYNMQLDAEWRGDEERRAYEAGKPKGEAYASMSERLKKMEEAEPGEREQAKGMAIFNAGLAMMAGNSPYALQNIAKGALAGTSEYAGALKEFKQAAKERMKLEADIEQARRAEARGDNETALKLLQRKNDRVDKIEEHMVDLGAKMGISKADVAAKVDLLRTELSSRERIAAAQLAQEPGDIRSLRALMADPNLLDMLRTSKTIGGESSLLQKMVLEAVKDPAGFKAMEKLNPGVYATVMAEVAKLGGTASGVSPAESALIKQYLNKP